MTPETAAPAHAPEIGSRALFWLVVALTLASVLLLGYNFGEVNHNEQLPLVLRALNPDYLSSDWVINANQGFNHRSFYTALMALTSRVVGVPGAFFGVYLLSLLAWSGGIWALVRSIWPTEKAAPTAAVLAPLLLLFSEWGTLSNTLVFNNLVPALPSLALSVWFGVMLRRERFAMGAFLLLGAGLIHAQIGPLSGIFLLVAQFYALSENPAARRRLGRHFPLWLIAIALPLGLALISDDKRPLSAAQSREALDVLTYLRHPHHYIPGSWTREAWGSEFAWLAVVFIARGIAGASRFLDGILLAALAFCASGFVPFWADALFPLVKLQHFRMSIWLQIAGTIYLSQVVANWWHEKSHYPRVAGALLFGALLLPLAADSVGAYRGLLPLGLGAFWLASRRIGWIGFHTLLLLPWIPFLLGKGASSSQFALKILFIGGFGAAILALLLLWQRRPQLAEKGSQITACALAVALLLLFLRPPTGRLGRLNRVQTRSAYEKPDGPMEAWVKFNTPENAVFLIPPTLETFRLKANRAVVVDFKVFPWSDAGLLDWRARIDALAGAALPLGGYKPAALDALYADLSAARVKTLARRYGASYFLTTLQSKGDFSGFTPFYRDRKWRIFRLDH